MFQLKAALRGFLLLSEVPLLVAAIVNAVVALAAVSRPRPLHVLASKSSRRFAIIVPAWNEEGNIGRLLESLRTLEYPADRLDVFIVADNCTDETAGVAARYPVSVLSRTEGRRGKARAIGWALRRIEASEYDVCVFIDADSTASPNLIAVLNGCFEAGERVVQVYDGVLNADASPATALAHIAFRLHNWLRPRGRENLGISAGLNGNGMAMAGGLAAHVPWDVLGPTEDAELHLMLLEGGHRVHFEPRACVLAEMPASFEGLKVQNRRWDSGRQQIARGRGLRLVLSSLRSRRVRTGLAALPVTAPTDSFSALLAVCLGLAATVLRSRRGMSLAIVIGLCQGLGFIPALFEAGRAPLMKAAGAFPDYLVWKASSYSRIAARAASPGPHEPTTIEGDAALA